MKFFLALFALLAIAFGFASAECEKLCPFNYQPVCARDTDGALLNFGNKCALEVYNCQQNKELAVTFEHECPQ